MIRKGTHTHTHKRTPLRTNTRKFMLYYALQIKHKTTNTNGFTPISCQHPELKTGETDLIGVLGKSTQTANMLYRMSTPQISTSHSGIVHIYPRCIKIPVYIQHQIIWFLAVTNLRDFEVFPFANNLFRCQSSMPFLKAVSFQGIFSEHQKPTDLMGNLK